jgi:transcriptional regulator with XRE-family HTH domain
MGLAENLKRIRLQKQLTQPGLAEKVGVSKGYVYMLESGEMTNPTLDILHKIASGLDCTIADLTGDPKIAPRAVTELPESLVRFAKQRKRAGEALSEEDLMNLAQTQFRGKRPESVEDWAYVYEFLKRTFNR